LKDEAYIVKVKGNSQSEQLHLVFKEAILEVKKKS